MSPVVRYHMTIDEAREEGLLRTGDTLLYRGKGEISEGIKAVTGSEWSHAAKYGELFGVPWMAGVREWIGGHNEQLALQVKKYPGQIDVFQIDRERYPHYDGQKAFQYMMLLAGCKYGWGALFLAWCRHCWFTRLLARWCRKIPVVGWVLGYALRRTELQPVKMTLSNENGETTIERSMLPPYCSMAVDRSDVYAGEDPVPELASEFTEPGHLAQSKLYRYACTLVLEKEPDIEI